MKKTLTANISGTVFHIEEDAYEKLQRYLGNIRAQFTGTDGRDEIMADIEARIAELFSERLAGRNVVGMIDVDHVMSVMGQPEDFVDTDTDSATEPGATNMGEPQTHRSKRFFRDPDDRWIGGVMGGLGAYLNVDPLWLRIAMIVLVWASVGSLIPLYILLWILVPEADTAAERLQMRGEHVTVENIKRVVEEGAERVKHGGARMAEEAKDLGKGLHKRVSRNSGRAGRIVANIFGIAFIIVGFSMMLGMITAMIGGSVSLWHATWTSEDTGILDLGELIFNSRQQAIWFCAGAITLLLVPVIGLFLAGFRLLLRTTTPKWLLLSMIVLWILAWVPTMWAVADVAKDFKRKNVAVTEIVLAQPLSGTLYLDALDPTDEGDEWSMNYDDGEFDVDLDGLHLEKGAVMGAWGQLDVEQSADTLFHLKAQREARGRTAKAALARAEAVQYSIEQQEDVLLVSPVVRYMATDKFRGQDLHFTLEVPIGKSVFLRPGSKDIIYDIDNVTNTLDRHMLGRTWTMTEQGLEDASAPGGKRDDDRDGPVPTPTDTVRVNEPIAAVVWQGGAKQQAKRAEAKKARAVPRRLANAHNATPQPVKGASLLPNLFKLMVDRTLAL